MAQTVLVVDGEESITLSLGHALRRAGYAVSVAHDGDEALGVAARDRPDLVVLDAVLPRRSGIEVCRRLREDAALRHVRVLMLSGRAGDLDVEKGLAAGADAYLPKPFSCRAVAARVRELLTDAHA
jgi:DNA-binding response OmpR family regulator